MSFLLFAFYWSNSFISLLFFLLPDSRLCVHGAEFDSLWTECMEREFAQNALRPKTLPAPNDLGHAQVVQFNRYVLIHVYTAFMCGVI